SGTIELSDLPEHLQRRPVSVDQSEAHFISFSDQGVNLSRELEQLGNATTENTWIPATPPVPNCESRTMRCICCCAKAASPNSTSKRHQAKPSICGGAICGVSTCEGWLPMDWTLVTVTFANRISGVSIFAKRGLRAPVSMGRKFQAHTFRLS